jgi:hypothetical protein
VQTVSENATAGMGLVVFVFGCDDVTCSGAISQADLTSVGNGVDTFTFIKFCQRTGTGGLWAYYAANVAGGTHTITATFNTGGTKGYYGFIAWSSYTSFNTLDQSGCGAGTSTTPTATTIGNLSKNNEIVVGIALGAGGIAAGSGFTLVNSIGTNSKDEYAIKGTVGATTSATWTQTSAAYDAIVVTFTSTFVDPLRHTGNTVVSSNSIWKLQGTVLSASVMADQLNVLEPMPFTQTTPLVGLGCSGNTIGLFFDNGWATPNVNYAEACESSPQTLTRWGSNPVIANHGRVCMTINAGTMYVFAANTANTQIDLYSGANVNNLTLNTSAVVSIGSAGTWNATVVDNCWAFVESTVMYLYVEGSRSGQRPGIGLYTASSPFTTYAANGGNPLITGAGGPDVIKVGSTYWMWAHNSPDSTGLPTDIARYSSSDKVTWAQSPTGFTFPRKTADEGPYSSLLGQVADVGIYPIGNQVFMYYSASTDGSSSSAGLHIKLAAAAMPLATLVTTKEGN